MVKYFKNPYPDRVEGDELPVDVIIRLLFIGFPFNKLPPDVKEAVHEEMTRRHTKKYENTSPAVKESHLSLENVKSKLVSHEIHPDDLSPEMRGVIDEEIKQITGLGLKEWWNEYHAAKYETIRKGNSNS